MLKFDTALILLTVSRNLLTYIRGTWSFYKVGSRYENNRRKKKTINKKKKKREKRRKKVEKKRKEEKKGRKKKGGKKGEKEEKKKFREEKRILKYIQVFPLDQNIKYHKIIAGVIMVASVGRLHTTSIFTISRLPVWQIYRFLFTYLLFALIYILWIYLLFNVFNNFCEFILRKKINL